MMLVHCKKHYVTDNAILMIYTINIISYSMLFILKRGTFYVLLLQLRRKKVTERKIEWPVISMKLIFSFIDGACEASASSACLRSTHPV